MKIIQIDEPAMQPNILSNRLSIARQIWSAILFLLLGLAGGAAFIQHRISTDAEQAMNDLRHYEARIHNATTWKSLAGENVEGILSIVLSTDPTVVHAFTSRIDETSAKISALQDAFVAEAQSENDRAALQAVLDKRAVAQAARAQALQMQRSDAAATERQEFVADSTGRCNTLATA